MHGDSTFVLMVAELASSYGNVKCYFYERENDAQIPCSVYSDTAQFGKLSCSLTSLKTHSEAPVINSDIKSEPVHDLLIAVY